MQASASLCASLTPGQVAEQRKREIQDRYLRSIDAAYKAIVQKTDATDGLGECDHRSLRPQHSVDARSAEGVPVPNRKRCGKDSILKLERDGAVPQDVPLMDIAHGKVLEPGDLPEQQEHRGDHAAGGVLGLREQ